MRFRRPSPALLVALLALFLALDGPATAAKLINGKQLKAGSVSQAKLTPGAVKALKRVPDRAVGQFQLKPHAVTGSKIAAAAIGSTQIADGALTGSKLAPSSITAGAIAGNAVGATELAPDAVARTNLRTAAVGKSKLAKDAVGTDEVIDGTLRLGDLATFGGSAPVVFGAIAPDACATVDVPVTPVKGEADLTTALVLVGRPAGWPGEALTISGGAAGPGLLRVIACNGGSAAVTPGEQAVPYLAVAP